MTVDYQALVDRAADARLSAYAPYSKFLVGAALLCEDGSIYSGCNVENASYGLTNCAERTAIFKAVSDGKRKFRAIAIVLAGEPSPCGACRQVIFEFGGQIEVVLASTERLQGPHKVLTIAELLPGGFGPESLGMENN